MHLVLLHALARTGRSMRPLGRALEGAGHTVDVVPYPSRARPLEGLAEHVLDRLERTGVRGAGDGPGFVGHSMGGVVYRSLRLVDPDFRCGRSVLLGSPAAGSLVAETLARLPPVRWAYGLALPELERRRVDALPEFPGPTGCIAGTHASPLVPASWVLRLVAPGEPSDSTVLVREALHPAAADHATVHASHTFLPSNAEVTELVLRFLAHGSFTAR